ncbi:PAS-domain containing protein [Sagittula sp. MA-2]|jgi:signal transduction histidine kinase/CheY-like chemotaxis protein|uniref:hybrid sensor histidine kinase/response regulator n=1 Tax=Sagittula sp. MA-2 TaxID=3048007 RepID=UPI0024C33671|nr:PAS-domain containing protein [Sagittula sp. MA-2]WHZ36148.1 PAS-domain containing protein [Sagittula sp. MA-2]
MTTRADTAAFTLAGLNLIQQALSIFDRDLRLVLVNRPMQAMFDLPDTLCAPGTTFEAVIRHLATTGEYGPIDDLDTFIDARVSLARTFEPHYMERQRANGRTIAVEGAPLPQGGWVTVYTDITAIRQQEELLRSRSESLSEEVLQRSEELARTNRQLAATITALEETRRQLMETEARTRTTTEMMPAHIARVDATGRYTFSNNRLADVMPGRPASIVGLHISDTLGPEAYARVQPHLDAAFAGRASTFEFSDEASSRRIRAAFTPDPLEPGVYILSQDVTEETQARAALQQTRRREIAAQLTSGLAHDFSNLLTIILGQQAKLARLDLPGDAPACVTATLQAARRGGTLLERIADITSPRTWQPKPMRLAPFLDDLANLAAPTLPEGLTLTMEDNTTAPPMADPGLLQDALLNLVLNARDACAGRAEAQITIAAHELQGTWLEIAVTDTGPGFSPDALDHGTAPFFTTKGGEGSGLGLAMVYDMTKLAGGALRLSNGATGARVTLRLPLRHALSLPASGLVLLVEDSPDLRAPIRDMLTGLGYAVAEASSVPEALALAETLEVALILSDITLEGSEPGHTLADHLPQIPLRLMTSLPPGDPRHRAARARAPVIAKPFTPETLANALRDGERTP